jgi:cysteinyl-tRNA synthetase
MSKSLGNFVTIRDLLTSDTFGGRSWPGEVLRLAMLRTHYRQPIDWTVKALEEAETALRDWAQFAGRAEVGLGPEQAGEPHPAVIAALSDDLNTPAAMTELFGLAKQARGGDVEAAQWLAGSAEFLGLNTLSWLSRNEVDAALRDIVDAKVAERIAARSSRNWAESDRIRDELVAMGIQIMDAKDPITGDLSTTWEVKR